MPRYEVRLIQVTHDVSIAWVEVEAPDENSAAETARKLAMNDETGVIKLEFESRFDDDGDTEVDGIHEVNTTSEILNLASMQITW